MRKNMFLWFIVRILTIFQGYELNICDPVDDRLKFEIIELRCNLDRNDLFTFNSRRPQLKNVQLIAINRLTDHSFVKVENAGKLQEIRVKSEECNNIPL